MVVRERLLPLHFPLLSLSLLLFFSSWGICLRCRANVGGRGRGRWRRRSATVFVCIATEREGSGGEEKQRDCSRGESTYVAASSLMPLPLLQSREERECVQRPTRVYVVPCSWGRERKADWGIVEREEGEGRRKEGEEIWNTSSYSSPDPRYGPVSAQAKERGGTDPYGIAGPRANYVHTYRDMQGGAKFVSRRCDNIWDQGSRVLCNN